MVARVAGRRFTGWVGRSAEAHARLGTRGHLRLLRCALMHSTCGVCGPGAGVIGAGGLLRNLEAREVAREAGFPLYGSASVAILGPGGIVAGGRVDLHWCGVTAGWGHGT